MKKSLIVSLVLLSIAFSGFAQSQRVKVIALVNKASWCHVCKENGPRFGKNIMPMIMENKNVQIVMNDLSDNESKANSIPMLKKAGVAEFAQNNTSTGTLYFVDSESKK